MIIVLVLAGCFIGSAAWLTRYALDARGHQQLREALDWLHTEAEELSYAPREKLFLLRVRYPAVAAWLSLPGLALSEPVCEAPDNDYYVTHDFTGRESRYGALFFDVDDDAVIYGHYSKQGDMFGALKAYADPAFLAAQPVVLLETQAGATRWTVTGAQVIPAETFWRWKAAQVAAHEPPLLFLVTCAYDFPDARLVLTAVQNTDGGKTE